jgi:hypothetical protein
MKRETLARRLNLAPGAIDQLVKRDLLPPPVQFGEAVLWRWQTVDDFISRGHHGAEDDPYMRGLHAAETAAPRLSREEQGRPALSLLPAAPRDSTI